MGVLSLTEEEKKIFRKGWLSGVQDSLPIKVKITTNKEIYNGYNNTQLLATENGTYKIDMSSGYTGFDTVVVDVPDSGGGGGTDIRNEDITITKNGTYKASPGYTGLGTVVVDVETVEPDPPPQFPTAQSELFGYTITIDGYNIQQKLCQIQEEIEVVLYQCKLCEFEEVGVV